MTFNVSRKPGHRVWPAIALMLLYALAMAISDSMAKELGTVHPMVIVVWYRYLFHGLVLGLIYFLQSKKGKSQEVTGNPVAQIIRALFLVLSTLVFFESLTVLALAEAMSLLYVFPVVAVVLSAIYLKEKLDMQQVFLIFLIFIGVVIVINPQGNAQLIPGLLALTGGVLMGIYVFLTKTLSGGATPLISSLYGGVIGIVIVPFFPGFELTLFEGPYLLIGILMGAIAAVGHFSMFQSMRYSQAVIVSPFAFAEIIFAAIIGFFWFKDAIDLQTILGIVLVVFCSVLFGAKAHYLYDKIHNTASKYGDF